MPRAGPRSVRRYSDEFKLTAVRLSQNSHEMTMTPNTRKLFLTTHITVSVS